MLPINFKFSKTFARAKRKGAFSSQDLLQFECTEAAAALAVVIEEV